MSYGAGRIRVSRRVVVTCGLAAGAAAGITLSGSAPSRDIALLARHNPSETSYMRLEAAAGGPPVALTARSWAPIDRLPLVLVCAIIKAEDRRFFFHHGFEPAALWRAAKRRVTSGEGPGASTITQQLARNLYLGPERTLARKAREFVLARQLEDALTKRRIFELYLNVAQWGNGIWGVASASSYYFGRPVENINTFEATFLASMLAAPKAALQGKNRDRAYESQRRVLQQLVDAEVISAEDAQAAFYSAKHWYDAVGQGISWQTALREAAELYRSTSPALEPRYDVSAVWRDGCGYSIELAKETGEE
jgi:monofunctional glycosyltransferase